MKLMILIVHVIFFITLNVQFDGRSNQVDAAPKHAKQLGWFGSIEQVEFQNLQVTPTTTESLEIKPPKQKILKKKKGSKKKKTNERMDTDKQELKRKKKQKKKDQRRFVKTTVREQDGEYNASSSIENVDRRKPVDIIVHIKMHD